jgi:hypothetical protein
VQTARLSGWQRLGVALTVLWQVPVFGLFALWVSDGSLRLYEPPQMTAWEVSCSLDEVVGATRAKYPLDYGDLSDAELKTKIAAKFFPDPRTELKIEFWVPKDGGETVGNNVGCADVEMVENPEKKHIQLAV